MVVCPNCEHEFDVDLEDKIKEEKKKPFELLKDVEGLETENMLIGD